MNSQIQVPDEELRAYCLDRALSMPASDRRMEGPGGVIELAERFCTYIKSGTPSCPDSEQASPAHVHDDDDKRGGRPRPEADAASAPDASAGDAQAESDRPSMPEDKRAAIAKSVEAITPVLKMLYFVGGCVEVTDTGTRVPRFCVILPRNGMRHISAEEKSCFAQIEMALTILWAVGCRCHVQTGVAGSIPTVHWTMPAGF
ncbi:hypothetical protein K6L44_12335 [Gluconacetobacter entanii]|uniref:hypothetical protein n=1 Tax=Gluconacetobacter entanii TaxID=108528 RepID=UPI001C935041|nr:hypothetical protein [Gluconacetobacter entanii]MBY4640756.1 hypothetical protein [Gluconacetobacter entanii]MCW4581217.1 hypothetical protein [Gluconacetobacter entanii]MCW4584477.1 hypothetical protein [Gluconacetobacter entanii]MCW4587859.1 hypothetical protein [Gluconacetobacter entanii]